MKKFWVVRANISIKGAPPTYLYDTGIGNPPRPINYAFHYIHVKDARSRRIWLTGTLGIAVWEAVDSDQLMIEGVLEN